MTTIQNETQYKAIMSRIDELVERVDDTTPEDNKEFIELDLLVGLVSDYEHRVYGPHGA